MRDMKIISAAEANRHFSTLLRDVSHGDEFVVISRGRPVATIGPAPVPDAQRRAARDALMKRLLNQSTAGVRHWTRDELYDR
jgi:prevent-host-death family protein